MNQENQSVKYKRQYQEMKIGTLKKLGGINCVIGIILEILSLIAIIIDGSKDKDRCFYGSSYAYGYRYSYRYCYSYKTRGTLLGFDATCFILSGWILITEVLLFCMDMKRLTKWRCLVGGSFVSAKITFMVMCITSASIVMPTVFSLGIVGSFFRISYGNGEVALSALIAIISFVEFVVSIVTASVCCCCSSFGETRGTTYVYVESSQLNGEAAFVSPNTNIQMSYIQNVQPTSSHEISARQGPVSVMTQQLPVLTQQTGSGITIMNTEQPPQYTCKS